MSKKLQVGMAYTTMGRFDQRHIFHIIYRDTKQIHRQFVGISKAGGVAFFDEAGKDEWFEFGGHWNELDLSTATPARFTLVETAKGDDVVENTSFLEEQADCLDFLCKKIQAQAAKDSSK